MLLLILCELRICLVRLCLCRLDTVVQELHEEALCLLALFGLHAQEVLYDTLGYLLCFLRRAALACHGNQ